MATTYASFYQYGLNLISILSILQLFLIFIRKLEKNKELVELRLNCHWWKQALYYILIVYYAMFRQKSFDECKNGILEQLI